MVTTRTNLTDRRYVGRYGSGVDLIGIHTMESSEGSQTAENVAAYFKRVNASSHWTVDNDSRVRVVRDEDTAWTLPGANSRSLNIEIAGYARQTPADWADAYSVSALEISALCSAEWVIKYGISIRHLNDSQIRNGEKGFVGHADISRVYKKSSHWDPGPSFPWDYFLDRVRANVNAIRGGAPSAPTAPQPATPSNNGFSVAHIKARQQQLNSLGYKLAVDGIRGPATIAAVKDFQSKHGLVVDGLPGAMTTASLTATLLAALSGKTPPSTPRHTRPNCAQLQRAVRATQDNLWGADTDKRLHALVEASMWGGHEFPYGKAYTQHVIGVKGDGIWGRKSIAAHDAVVAAVQVALKGMGFNPGGIDSKWGPATEAAYRAARSACRI